MKERRGPTWDPDYQVGDFVWVPDGGGRSGRPGRIIRFYPAHYDSIGPHWRYVIRYVKTDLSDYKYAREASCFDGRAESFSIIDPLDALARTVKRRAR